MGVTEKRIFDLAPEQAGYIDKLVGAGAYASASDVIDAGLKALQERDADLDQWLRDEVLPVMEAMDADPSRAFPADQVFDEMRTLHAKRVKDAGEAA